MRTMGIMVSLLIFLSGSLVVDAAELKTPRIAVTLPDACNTPDGMTLDEDGNIWLACPNGNDQSYPGVLMKIDGDDQLTKVIECPPHPETGKAFPLGIAFGADGNLYVADNQEFGGRLDHQSRLLRLIIKDGKPVKWETVVEGFVIANGVDTYGDYVYVVETKLVPDAYPLPSGVYQFKISELDGSNPIKLEKGGSDPHLIATTYTENREWLVGTNGIGTDKDGNVIFVNFGDTTLFKLTIDDGKVLKKELITAGQGMESCDGLKIHPETGDVYIADFVGNAVHKVDIETGVVKTIAKNGDTDGANGELDKCSELCFRGDKLYVSNIDLPFGGNTSDRPWTISVIDLDD